MSLTDAQVTGLLETFRRRAEAYMRSAQEAGSVREVIKFTAFASTLDWAAREVRLLAGLPVEAPAPTNTERAAHERALADAAHDAEDSQP